MTQKRFSFDEFLACHPLPTNIQQAKKWLILLNQDIDKILSSLSLDDQLSLIDDTLKLRIQAMDCLLIHLFTPIAKDQPLALFAIGGYGRGELFPYSDVDMLILYGTIDKSTNDKLHHFIATLWDIGITPAITLRPVNDSSCANDLTVANSLFESRWLVGDCSLSFLPTRWAKKAWSTKDFLSAKLTETAARHALTQHHYALEPNIKTNLGGLRDIHLLQWVFRFYTNLPPSATLDPLFYQKYINQNEYRSLMDALHFFWVIRHHLHMSDTKDSNRLDFGHQKKLASKLGFGTVTNANVRPAEMLMKTYYRHAMTVATLSPLLCHLLAFHLEKPSKVPIDKNFYILYCHNKKYIGLLSPTSDPTILLSLFIAMDKHHCDNIDPSTLRTLLNHSYRISQKNPSHQSLFLAILTNSNRLYERLLLLKKTGILGAYLPDFARIIGLMQYDLFHEHTVDVHTLLVVYQFSRFEKENFGLLSAIYTKLDNKLPLIIAALFHDIGKGQGGNHSEKGAMIAEKFCKTHHLPKKDRKLIVWLVRHHLVMSITAQKKDIFDSTVIDDFATFATDIDHLNHLYLLTVADMNATNSQLWNNWRATLLEKLYLNTQKRLTQRQQYTNSAYIINAKKHKAKAILGNLPNVLTLWQCLPDEYFLTQPEDDIVWHTYAILLHQKNSPLVIIKPYNNQALHAFKLFVRTQNQRGVFGQIATILDVFDFAVLDAQILNDHAHHTVNSYIIAKQTLFDGTNYKSKVAQTKTSQQEIALLIDTLTKQLICPMPYSLITADKKRLPKTALQHFHITTQVYFEQTSTGQYLHLITKDRPALLAIVGQLFTKLDIWVHSAKIGTLGERAEDVFGVSDIKGGFLSFDKQTQLCQALVEKLSKPS